MFWWPQFVGEQSQMKRHRQTFDHIPHQNVNYTLKYWKPSSSLTWVAVYDPRTLNSAWNVSHCWGKNAELTIISIWLRKECKVEFKILCENIYKYETHGRYESSGTEERKEKGWEKKKPLHSDEGDTALRTVKPCTERGQFNIWVFVF